MPLPGSSWTSCMDSPRTGSIPAICYAMSSTNFCHAATRRSNNVFWLASREVVFTAGSIAIVASVDSLIDPAIPPRQRFFTKHTQEIGSICLHPDGMLVATAEDAAEVRRLSCSAVPYYTFCY
eukprot:2809014-Rhodomonas_salina.3